MGQKTTVQPESRTVCPSLFGFMTIHMAVTAGSGIGPIALTKALSQFRWPASITVFSPVAPPLPIPTHVTWHVVTSQENVQAPLVALLLAISKIESGECQVLVTGPVEKSAFLGYRFSSTHFQNFGGIPGHTEILGDRCGVVPCMAFLNTQFRVALLTQHLALRDVSAHVTISDMVDKGKIFLRFLRSWTQKKSVHIGVCGLNPHAKIDRYTDAEEEHIVVPAVSRLREDGDGVDGPISPDTAFFEYERKRWDGMISLYHDHALTFIKGTSFWQTVNVTLGLPFVRVSVDHGPTASGSDVCETNFLRALEWAVALRLFSRD